MNKHRYLQLALLVGLLALMLPGLAFAGTSSSGGEEFNTIYEWVKGLITGTLGKLIALAFFLVGMAMGIVRQSVMAFVIGVGAAIILYYGPEVIENIFGAALPLA